MPLVRSRFVNDRIVPINPEEKDDNLVAHFAPRRIAVATAAGVLATLGLGVVSPALAEDSVSSSARSITSPAFTTDGKPMNYAVNLTTGTTAASFDQAVSLAEQWGVSLQKYPQFSSFFIQSVDPQFAEDLSQALNAAGITFDSIGPTRQAAVTGNEVVVPLENPTTRAAANERASTGLADGSQLEDFTPDPSSSQAWGLSAIGAIEAQKVDVELDPVVVGVLDTGIAPDHPDLKDQINTDLSVGCQYNGIPRQGVENWADDHYHGTHVAGTIAAAHNGIGVDGVAPHTTLAAVKTSNSEGLFYPEYVVCAFVWAADHNFDVTNNSYYVDPWAYWLPNEPTQAAGLEVVARAVQYADDHDVVNVVAAGNSSHDLDHPTTDDESPNDVGADNVIKGRDVSNGLDIPGMLDSVVTVSAVARPYNADAATATLSRSRFSNYGVKNIEVAAPGSSIYSTFPASRNYYGTISGTSMASPHVAGVVALLRGVDPTRSATETKEVLYRQAEQLYSRLAEPTDGSEYRGHGLVNALGAVLEDQPSAEVTLSYSTDAGETWKDFSDATSIRAPFIVRAHVTGPATSVLLNVASDNAAVDALLPKLSQDADGSFDGDVMVTTEEIDPAELRSAARSSATSTENRSGALSLNETDDPLVLSIDATAYGRNNDARAADDTTVASIATLPEVSLSVHPANAPADSLATSGAGSALILKATGLQPGDSASFSAGSLGLLGTATVDAEGVATLNWTVGKETKAATYTLSVTGAQGGSASTALAITAAPAEPETKAEGFSEKSTATPVAARVATGLAATGADTPALLALVALSAVVGIGGVALARRHK